MNRELVVPQGYKRDARGKNEQGISGTTGMQEGRKREEGRMNRERGLPQRYKRDGREKNE